MKYSWTPTRMPNDCSVYFIEAVGVNRIKIGMSREPRERLRDLQTCCPCELKLLGHSKLYNESALHERFKHLRRNGEWFEATDALREFIIKVSSPGSRPAYFEIIDGVLAAARESNPIPRAIIDAAPEAP